MGDYLTTSKVTKNGSSKQAGRIALHPILLKAIGAKIGDTVKIRQEGNSLVVELLEASP